MDPRVLILCGLLAGASAFKLNPAAKSSVPAQQNQNRHEPPEPPEQMPADQQCPSVEPPPSDLDEHAHDDGLYDEEHDLGHASTWTATWATPQPPPDAATLGALVNGADPDTKDVLRGLFGVPLPRLPTKEPTKDLGGPPRGLVRLGAPRCGGAKKTGVATAALARPR